MSSDAKLQIRALTASDVERAEHLARTYLGDMGASDLRSCAAATPELPLVAIAGGDVVGLCFGTLRGEDASLQGIAVDQRHAARGLGSRLLAAFERVVRACGARRVTTGSAEGYVERFYAKNGYTPIEYFVRASTRPRHLAEIADLELVRTRDGDRLLNVRSTRGYGRREKERVRALFAASEVNVIFEKRLDRMGAGVVPLRGSTPS